MPLVLTVHPDEPARRVSVPLVGDRITIGSAPSANVKLLALVAEHAVAERQGSRWRLISTHELAVGGVPLADERGRLLLAGCRIQFGPTEIAVEDADTVAPHADVKTAEIALRMLRHADEIGAHASKWSIVVVEGGDATTFTIADGTTMAIGRDAELSLEDARVSRRHVEVRAEGGRLDVRDLGSSAGSLLAGHPLEPNRWAHWPAESHLRVGRTVLAIIPPRDQVLAEKMETLAQALPEPEPPPEKAPDPVAAPAEEAPPAAPAPPAASAPVVAPPEPIAELPRRTGLHPAVLPVGIGAIALLTALLLVWILRG